MLTGSTFTGGNKLRTRKATLVLVGFVSVFLVASLAIGLRTANASLPISLGRGCHGSGEGGDAVLTCSTSSTLTTTSSPSSSSSTTKTSTTTTVTDSTISTTQGPQDPVTPVAPSNCNALNGISYQLLAAGTNLTIAFNGNGQMTFTVPSESFSWNWYFVPANGASTTTLGQQITTTMWSSGHGQDFSFFVAQLNGQTGIVLQTDYALSQACS
jgi:hypothetical protein